MTSQPGARHNAIGKPEKSEKDGKKKRKRQQRRAITYLRCQDVRAPTISREIDPLLDKY